MPVIPEVLDYLNELTQIRRDIHAHPELGFTEERTGDLVAQKLAEYGCEVHRGLAKTGVVGTIRRGNSLRAIGLSLETIFLQLTASEAKPEAKDAGGTK